MKTLTGIVLLAAALAAQQQPGREPDPRIELARAIAAEEQQRDAATAEQLYRAALDDPQRSPAAKALARERLIALLRRLGRDDEARAFARDGKVAVQDDVAPLGAPDAVQRELELREQAKQLLDQLTKSPRHAKDPMSVDAVERLVWIGDAGVPEIGARIDRLPTFVQEVALTALWRIEGPRASDLLVQCSKSKRCHQAAECARGLQRVDVDAPEVRAFLENEDARIAREFLDRVVKRITADGLLRIAERGAPWVKAGALLQLGNLDLTPEQVARAHALCKAARAGTDPEVGNAADTFLAHRVSQRTQQGIVLLLDAMPNLVARDVRIEDQGTVNGISRVLDERMAFDLDPAALVPAIDRCIQTGPQRRWLTGLMRDLLARGDAALVPAGVRWWRQGFDVWTKFRGKLDTANAELVFAGLPLVDEPHLAEFLGMFVGVDLPAKLWPEIRAVAERHSGREFCTFAQLAGQTGQDEVVGWLLQQNVERDDNGMRNRRATQDSAWWLVQSLLELGRRNHSEAVRAAMRRVASEGSTSHGNMPGIAFALFVMGDPEAGTIPPGLVFGRGQNPYAGTPQAREIEAMPLDYLLYPDQDPPCPYGKEQLRQLVHGFVQHVESGGIDLDDDRVPDFLYVEFADRGWAGAVLERLDERLRAGQSAPELRAWFERCLQVPDYNTLVIGRHAAVTEAFRAQFVALLDGPSEGWACHAFDCLHAVGEPLDVLQSLRSRHVGVRLRMLDLVGSGEVAAVLAQLRFLLTDEAAFVRERAARLFGTHLDVEAVPGLIALLRDPVESVRQAATDALTRIRFFHDEQSHWERVRQGIDATPASACEKLLLQAKPGQPKAQRLMAVESLGVLGQAEALPFLIDWTQDADAEVAAAARAAITAIHLAARK